MSANTTLPTSHEELDDLGVYGQVQWGISARAASAFAPASSRSFSRAIFAACSRAASSFLA